MKSWYGEYELKHGMQAENGITYVSNMSGEMHMEGRHDARMRYSATYPTGAERIANRIISLMPYLYTGRRVNTIVIIRRNANEWN